MFVNFMEAERFTVVIEENGTSTTQVMETLPGRGRGQFSALMVLASKAPGPVRVTISRMRKIDMSKYGEPDREIEESIQFTNRYWDN